MAMPPIPIGAYDTLNKDKSRWIRKKLENGIDCGRKCPFKITFKIFKDDLLTSQKTKFYNLHNLPGARIALKYYPSGKERLAIKLITSDQEDYLRMGVSASVYVSSIAEPFAIQEYARRHRYKIKFGTHIMDAKAFIKEFMQKDGVEFAVEGYVFNWNKKLMAREEWTFGPGISGNMDRWNSQAREEVHGINLEFLAKDEREPCVAGNLEILAKASEKFAQIKYVNDSSSRSFGIGPLPLHTPVSSHEAIEAGVKLCYDYRLVGRLSFDTKLELLLFLDKFKISNYKFQLEQNLLQYVNYANVGLLAKYAHEGNSAVLRQKCLDFIQKCIRKNRFFLGYNYDVTRSMIVKACELETYHQWIVPVLEDGEEEEEDN